MKLAKRIKKAIVVLLCTSMVITNVLPSFAEGNNENEPAIEEVVENEAEEAIEEIVEDEPEENSEDIEVEPVEDEVCEEEPEEDLAEEVEAVEDIPEEVEEEENISSPSEIIEEPEEENDSIPADMIEEPEEDEVIDEPEEPMLLGSIASPSDTVEVEEVEDEIEEATPSELEVDMPMFLGAPLFGDPLPSDVCKIGSIGYANLEAAISAVTTGQTITMLQNVTYGTPITINNGKTFTIDFNDGSTSHTFTWDDTTGSHTDKDIFTISNSSNVTVKNMKYLIGTGEAGNRIFKVNNTGTLTLKDMVCDSADNIKDTPVVNNGGTVTIDGGDIAIINESSLNLLNPVVQNLGGTTTFTGNGTFTTQNMTGAAWIGRVITAPGQSTDADRDSNCGTVIIENGTFNTGQIFTANGKGNITIDNATCDSGLAIIRVFHGGIKSNITIKNITATSTNIFAMVHEELQTKIDFQNGNVKYKANGFCTPNLSTPINSISIKNGKFGPITGSTDIRDEINNLLATGATITAISEGGYTYKVETPPPVCKIGSIEYPTLEAALSAVTSGQIITMIDDISYTDGTDFIIDGKTVTINFDGHTMTVNTGMSSPTVTKLFTVTNSGNLTVDNGIIALSAMLPISSFIVSGTNSKLTLIDVTQANKLDNFLTLDGGTATINGGTFGTNNTEIKINLTNNATIKLTNNPTFNLQGNLLKIGDGSNPDTLAANVTIDSGTFNGTNTIGIVELNGKANVTINGGTFTSSSANSAPIFIGNAGYKSSLTINNLTSDSPYVFESNNNSNIESFTANVNSGHYKYIKGKFAIDRSNSLKPNIRLKGGFYGPDVPDTDAFNELNDLCISGSEIQTLTSSDPEYANGYRYKIYSNTPSPTPTPTPHHGGGSSGGGGGGGSPRYDQEGNILGPSGIQSYGYDGSNPPNLSGSINISHWDYSVSDARTISIHYVQNIDSFVKSDNTPVVTEWVGVSMENSSKLVWYRTNANGQILRNQFIQLDNKIYYLDNNGIMVTGQQTINGKVYNFDTTAGANEGRFLY